MRLVAIALLLLLSPLAAAPARAELCRDWSTQDTVLQSVGTALILVDWDQTRKFAGTAPRYETICTNRGCSTTEIVFEETNPLLSRRPSAEEINVKIGTWLILFSLVSCVLPQSLRSVWQGFVIGFEGQAVQFNWRHGW